VKCFAHFFLKSEYFFVLITYSNLISDMKESLRSQAVLAMNIISAQEAIIADHLNALSSDPALAVLDGALSSATRACARALTDYGDDLSQAVRAIAEDACACAVELSDPRKNALTGLSGLPLFFARAGDKTIATIKAFPSSLPAYAAALRAQQIIYREALLVPRLLHAGIAHHDGQEFLLLVSQFVDGSLVNDLIFEMAALPHGEDRAALCHKIEAIMAKIGGLLATLHTAGPAFFGKTARIVGEIHEQALKKTLHGLQHAIDKNRLASSVTSIMQEMAHHEYRYAYLHGDAHPGNYLVANHSDEVYALDLDNGARSMGAHRQPLGSPFTDYIKLVASMRVREIFGVSPRETLQLRRAFDEGYQAHGGRTPSPRLEQYYTLMEVLDYCSWYSDHQVHLAPDAKAVMERILHEGLAWLPELIRATP
jgi:hypothetical protein